MWIVCPVQLNLYLSWLWDGKSVLYCAFCGKTEFNIEIILCKPRDCMHSFEFNRILFLSSSRKKTTTYECYICSSAKHCCPLSLFTSTPCYHTPTCTKLTCAHVKNKPRKLTPLGLYMLLCASVNPEISFSAHKYMATFATSPTLMTEEAWQYRSEGVGASGQGQGGDGERVVVSVKAMGERVL